MELASFYRGYLQHSGKVIDIWRKKHIRSILHYLHRIPHHNDIDKYGKIDVAKCAEREYKRNQNILVDYINPSDFIPTMKSMGAAKNEANNAAQSAPVEKTAEQAIVEVKETYDFSNASYLGSHYPAVQQLSGNSVL